MTDQPTTPQAWTDLLEAVTLLAKHPADEISPFNCTHDQLAVMAEASAFTANELARLEELGFHQDEHGTFYSFRYGSA